MRKLLLALCCMGGLAGCTQRPTEPASAAPLPAPVLERGTQWSVYRDTDKINDVRHHSLRADGAAGNLSLTIRCSSSVTWKSVSLYSEELWPADDRFYVSTRFDAEPGRSLEPWSGTRKIASPETREAEDALIRQLLTHRKFLARVGSSVMDKSVEDEFDLTGLADAYKAFDAECQGIRSPSAAPPRS